MRPIGLLRKSQVTEGTDRQYRLPNPRSMGECRIRCPRRNRRDRPHHPSGLNAFLRIRAHIRKRPCPLRKGHTERCDVALRFHVGESSTEGNEPPA